MQDSEWTLRWAPSWSVQVAFEGSHYITFSMIMRLFDFRMSGRMKVRMANDISSVSISFVQPPKLRLKTECSVSWGSVPLPLQTYIETVVQVRVARPPSAPLAPLIPPPAPSRPTTAPLPPIL